MKSQQQEQRKGICRRMAERYGGGGMRCCASAFCTEARTVIYGCRRILSYAPERILFSAGGRRRIAVEGEELYCASFSAGTVSVVGKVRRVEFLPAQVNGGDE